MRPANFLAHAMVTICVVACYDTRPSRITIDNRTMQDVVIANRLIPACGQIVFDPDRAGDLDPSAPAPSGAAVIPYRLPHLPDAATIVTLTVTPERIWMGALPSQPPCEGAAPSVVPVP